MSLDHVMIGSYEDAPNINKEEVEDYKWMLLDDVKSGYRKKPSRIYSMV